MTIYDQQQNKIDEELFLLNNTKVKLFNAIKTINKNINESVVFNDYADYIIAGTADLLETINNEVKEYVKNELAKVTLIGELKLIPYTVEDLKKYAPGWYYANGDRYTLDSDQGKAISLFPDNYKNKLGITIVNNTINLPNMFHTDGRGKFMRAGTDIGNVVLDAMQRIQGRICAVHGGYSGSYGSTYVGEQTPHSAGGSGIMAPNVYLDSSRETRTASETRVLYVELTPICYLGV